MDRPTSQYMTEETEFCLPEGVDLVGIEINRRKKQHQKQQTQTQRQRKKLSSGFMSAIKLVLINLFICALVLGYALLGSFVFLALEQHGSKNSGVHVQASGYPIKPGENNITHAILNSLQSEQVNK